MSTAITALDAVPLVRGDQPWQQFAVFYVDDAKSAAYDLTGKTVAAEIRWAGGEQAVTVMVTDAAGGRATLSLTAEQTQALPLGRLATLYIAVDTVTWTSAPVEVKEGLFNA